MRHKARVNVEWETPARIGWSWDHVAIEVLMDIRAELHRLNSVMCCQNFIGIPTTLRTISRKLPAQKKAKK